MNHTPLQKIIRILSKDPKERNVNDKKMLVELTKDIAFFQQYQENAYVHESCCSYMTHESYGEKETVFEINSIGDKFYIILEGSVGVYIYNESKELICVKKLMKGYSFGELALLYESPRMASIICLENCHFAVLQKREFLRVLKNEQKEKLNKKLLYLQGLPLFQKINQQLLRLIYSKAFDINTTKGQKIFKQGESTQNFYIVRTGEFSVKYEISDTSDKDEAQSIYSLENKELSSVTNAAKQKSLSVQVLFGLFQFTIKFIMKKEEFKVLLNEPNIILLCLKISSVSLLVQGDYFGEEDILQNRQKRSFTVQCMTASGEIIMVQKNLFMQILEEYHPNTFLREHLKIKEAQYQERINNAKRQMKKFKGFLMEDRVRLKTQKQMEEQQINFQKTNRSAQNTKEIILNSSRSIYTYRTNEDNQEPKHVHRKKKSITEAVINEESQRILNEKILKMIELKEQDQSKKPQIPSLQELRYHNQKQINHHNSPLIAVAANKSATFSADQSSPLNDQSYNSGKSPNTPIDSPNSQPKSKTQLLKILQQKPQYKQSLFNGYSLLDKYEKYSQNNQSEINQDFDFLDNDFHYLENEDAQTTQNNKSTTFKIKTSSQKNILTSKLSIQNLSQNSLQEYPQQIQIQKHSNNSNLINGRINQLRKAKIVAITEDSYKQYQARDSPQQQIRNKKIVSFSQNQSENQTQNISRSNDPQRVITNEQLKNLFDDGQAKFVSNYFNRSQVRKLTVTQKNESDSHQNIERAEIKKQLIRLKSKRENYIDYSSDDQKRQLIDKINILASPRQKTQHLDSIQNNNTSTITFMPRQSSQPTLRFIDLQKQDVAENNLRLTQNQLVNRSVTDIQKKRKQITDLNPQTFQKITQQQQQQQQQNPNLINGKQYMSNTSLIFKVDFGSSRSIQKSAPNSTSHLFNVTTSPQKITNILPSSTKNIFHSNSNQSIQTNNIHVRKEQESNKQKPLKMSIRFQNLFKNH